MLWKFHMVALGPEWAKNNVLASPLPVSGKILLQQVGCKRPDQLWVSLSLNLHLQWQGTIHRSTVMDPGFPRPPEECANLLFGQFFAENFMKMKQIGPWSNGPCQFPTLSGKKPKATTKVTLQEPPKLGYIFLTTKIFTARNEVGAR